MIYSPLTIGQRLSPDDSIVLKVMDILNRVSESKSENIAVGFCAEYCHNQEFEKANLEIILKYQTDPLDRIFNGLFQDDKIATWVLNNTTGKYNLTGTHTISLNECEVWKRELAAGRDVIIQSFVQSDPNSLDSIYMGALSFKSLVDYLHLSPYGKTLYFNRNLAYKWSRLN